MKNNNNIDEIDHKIIEMLVNNSRISFRAFSKVLKIGLATVSQCTGKFMRFME